MMSDKYLKLRPILIKKDLLIDFKFYFNFDFKNFILNIITYYKK